VRTAREARGIALGALVLGVACVRAQPPVAGVRATELSLTPPARPGANVDAKPAASTDASEPAATSGGGTSPLAPCGDPLAGFDCDASAGPRRPDALVVRDASHDARRAPDDFDASSLDTLPEDGVFGGALGAVRGSGLGLVGLGGLRQTAPELRFSVERAAGDGPGPDAVVAAVWRAHRGVIACLAARGPSVTTWTVRLEPGAQGRAASAKSAIDPSAEREAACLAHVAEGLARLHRGIPVETTVRITLTASAHDDSERTPR
jgi:hypothetical protein